MGAIGANVTSFALQVSHYKHHCQTLGQGWEQTYKLDFLQTVHVREI